MRLASLLLTAASLIPGHAEDCSHGSGKVVQKCHITGTGITYELYHFPKKFGPNQCMIFEKNPYCEAVTGYFNCDQGSKELTKHCKEYGGGGGIPSGTGPGQGAFCQGPVYEWLGDYYCCDQIGMVTTPICDFEGNTQGTM